MQRAPPTVVHRDTAKAHGQRAVEPRAPRRHGDPGQDGSFTRLKWRQFMVQDRERTVEAMLERLGRALSDGDAKSIPSCWQVPAFVLSDEGARCVNAPDEIETFFRQAIGWYRNQGLVATRARLIALQQLSPRLASADVRWTAFDAEGRERTHETSRYLLRLDDDGEPRIQVAVSLTAA
jgi:hypothetical protein